MPMITEMKKEITDADDNGNEENPEHAMTTCCVRKEEPLPPTEADEPTGVVYPDVGDKPTGEPRLAEQPTKGKKSRCLQRKQTSRLV